MKFSSNLFALFTVFCLIASVGMICAAGHGSVDSDNGSYYNPDNLEPGAGLPLENQTADVPMNVTGNQTTNVVENATGNVTGNATGNATSNNTSNVTANATHNANHPKEPTPLLSTGNPITVLIVLITALSGYTILKRKD